MKHLSIAALTVIFYTASLHSHDISLRFAQKQDIPAILALDKQVTDDYFIPVITANYGHLPAFQDPHAAETLCAGWDTLLAAIIENATNETDNNNHHILVATHNKNSNNIIGLCAFEKQDTALFINYLIVSQQVRNQGLGKLLLNTALSTYNDINSCSLETLAYGNESTLAFYDHYGFINTKQLCSIDERFPDTHYLLKLELNKK
jgi:N-acetylglutamate synthase-like GNAT family acetyltransferase